MVLVAFGFVGVAKCQTAVTGTEFRFTSRSAPGALANRYRLFISSTTGQLGCVTPSGASCLVLSGGAVAWGSLTGVPSTFPPSAHTHSGGDINTGVVSSAYGGTGFTTTPQDTILIGAGTGGLGIGGGWNQVTLCNGVLSYSTSTGAITCPTISSFSPSTSYTITAPWTFNPSNITPQAAMILDIVPSYGGTPGFFSSHTTRWCGSAYDGTTTYHPCWRIYNTVSSNTGFSRHTIGFRLQDANSWDDAFSFGSDHTFNILPASADSTCTTGQYWFMPNSTTGTWRKCQNGTISDVGSGTGGTTGVAGVSQQYWAWCTATASSSTTIVLTPFGSATAGSCTATNTANEMPMSWAGTIKNLRVKANNGGSNAVSSGVVTLYKNGVATGMTCTMGTGNSCNDTTHTFAVNAGDTISIRVGTAASETLSSIRATFDDVGGGFGFNNRGTWAATTVYNPYDVVQNTVSGVTSTYVNNQTAAFTSGATFGTGTGETWTLLASGGSAGGTFTGGTLTSKLTLAPSTASAAMLNLGPGSVTVTSGLTAGDAWLNSSADFQWYNGSVTRTAERTDRKGAASGYAGLDSAAVVPRNQTLNEYTWSPYTNTTYSSTATYARTVFDNAITITRIDIATTTAAAACTTFPVIRVGDLASNNTDITMGTTTRTSSTGLTQNIPAGTELAIRLNTAAAGCTTTPSSPYVTVHYKLQ